MDGCNLNGSTPGTVMPTSATAGGSLGTDGIWNWVSYPCTPEHSNLDSWFIFWESVPVPAESHNSGTVFWISLSYLGGSSLPLPESFQVTHIGSNSPYLFSFQTMGPCILFHFFSFVPWQTTPVQHNNSNFFVKDFAVWPNSVGKTSFFLHGVMVVSAKVAWWNKDLYLRGSLIAGREPSWD